MSFLEKNTLFSPVSFNYLLWTNHLKKLSLALNFFSLWIHPGSSFSHEGYWEREMVHHNDGSWQMVCRREQPGTRCPECLIPLLFLWAAMTPTTVLHSSLWPMRIGWSRLSRYQCVKALFWIFYLNSKTGRLKNECNFCSTWRLPCGEKGSYLGQLLQECADMRAECWPQEDTMSPDTPHRILKDAEEGPWGVFSPWLPINKVQFSVKI